MIISIQRKKRKGYLIDPRRLLASQFTQRGSRIFEKLIESNDPGRRATAVGLKIADLNDISCSQLASFKSGKEFL